MVDIDGGIGTVFCFASKGTRELPNDTVVLDGGLERLGREGTFVGQHVYTSRPGVAVQINAFNFPVWGMLEKLAPAFLAGLPTHRQAGQPDGVPHRARRPPDHRVRPPARGLPAAARGQRRRPARRADRAGLGRVHRLGAHRRPAAHPPDVLHGGVRLGVEADSLNCSILGPDVTTDDPEFDLFVKGVVTEMTVKAGQKCTAIRRVIVPAAIADDGRRGDHRAAREDHRRQPRPPRRPDGRAGVSLDQREEVRKAVQALRASAEIVFGDPDRVDVVDADAERGAFLSPVLLRADQGAVEPHDVEPFGPVSTVLTYDSVDEAVALAARGKGSLVGSLVTHDPDVARAGRRSASRRGTAGSWCSTATTRRSRPATARRCRCWCTAVPAAPAAARSSAASAASLHHMQRTAIQASPDMMTAITGRWTTGSQRRVERRAPVPQEPRRAARSATPSTSAPRRVTLEDIEHFAEFTGDTFYAHTDPEAAAAEPALRRHRRARLPRRLARRRAVRRPRPGPGAGQLRRRPPAVPHPGQGRRHDRGAR